MQLYSIMCNLTEAYKMTFERLVKIAMATIGCDESTAEDIVQDVFLAITKNRPDIKDADAYLVGAVTKRALHARRSKSIEPINFTDMRHAI